MSGQIPARYKYSALIVLRRVVYIELASRSKKHFWHHYALLYHHG